jgi:hypothetical protein
MLMDKFAMLTEENFELFAKLKYTNPSCMSIDEFNDDMKRIKYIKRLFFKFDNERILKDRLICNHILILCNVFGVEPSIRMLFFKIEKQYHGFLKTFLKYLNILPKSIPEVNLDLIQIDGRIERQIAKNAK